MVQSGLGVNPQTATDIAVAIIDACGGDLPTATEAMLLITRILQVPQSTIEELYIDEIDLSGKTAKDISTKHPEELASRYARYKFRRSTPMTFWSYSDEKQEEREKSYLKSFNKKLQERIKLDNPETTDKK